LKWIYFLLLSIFIFRVAWAALPYDTESIDWYWLSDEKTTAQFAFWRLMLFLVEGVLMLCIMGVAYETNPVKKYHAYQMARTLLLIQGWYILEYCIHYTSVWVTWEQLGFIGNGRSGLSSHIITMSIFAYFGHD